MCSFPNFRGCDACNCFILRKDEGCEKLDLRAQECLRALLILQAKKKTPKIDNLIGSY